jgi:DNA-binding protein HU-beta
MNKADLIEAIAGHADLTKVDAGKALDAFCEAITGAMKKGEDVVLVGFGTFTLKTREARTGRNPSTGATIEIAASNSVGFKAGKGLKDAVN